MKGLFHGIRILTVAFALLLSLPTMAQDKAALEKNKKALEEEINYNQKLLRETSKNKQSSSGQVVILNDNIKKRERLIADLNGDIKSIDNNIKKENARIDTLKSNLESLRKDYSNMIRIAHKTESAYSQLAFIFAAEDFNQAFLRLRYLQQLTSFRRKQAEGIKETQVQIETLVQSLEKQKEAKEAALQEERAERNKLAEDKKQVNLIIRDLEKKEKSIKSTLAAKKKEAANLEKKIQQIIAEEIRKAEEARRAANATASKSGDFALTPAEVALSNDFASNKGKLPWPVEKGLVSGTHGQSTHPALHKVTVQNNGIDIMTNAGSKALAVFSGTVTRTWSMPGYNNIVMIRHGEYITVYSKLDNVTVKAGDNVSTRQPIGTIHTDVGTGKTEIHFELWKGKLFQNPSLWLAPF